MSASASVDQATLGASLDRLQRDAFAYFQHEVNEANGLILDKTDGNNWPASVSATGMALAAYPVAVERGFMTRQAARQRVLTTLRGLWNSPQGPQPEASGYRGFFYHMLDLQTGRRAWKCELSTVDSAFLFAGALSAAQYFNDENPDEHAIRSLARQLYERADWQWAQNHGATLTHGWKPESGFLSQRWEGYDEALVMYMLGLGSPTHPLPAESYAAFVSTYVWKKLYGYEYLYSGPLFTHQYSQIWIDMRGLRDEPMRAHDLDYFENSRRATYVQQQYAIANPKQFEGYGEHSWGITASDGPGPQTRRLAGVQRSFFGYAARGAPFGPDDGTLSPWAAVTSLPFAPELVVPTMQHFDHLRLGEGRYGYEASFNPTFPSEAEAAGERGWMSPYHFGINQGPVVLMVENYRSGLIWGLTRGIRPIVVGLRRAGFKGGWL